MFNAIQVLRIAFAIVLVCIFVSCSSNKDSFIQDFELFISETEANIEFYTDEEWEAVEEEFADFSERGFKEQKNEMSSDEISRVNELIGKYHAMRLKKGLEDFKTGIEDGIEQAKGFIKEVLPDSDKTSGEKK